MHLSRKTLLETPKLNVSPVWCNKSTLRLDGFCSHQRVFLQIGIHGRAVVAANECVWAAPCLLPPTPAIPETHKGTLLPDESSFLGKAKLTVALTSMTWEGLLPENTAEKVHLCKH